MTGIIKIYLWRAFFVLALAGLTACDSQTKPADEQVIMDATSIQVPLPQQLRATSAIDPAAVTSVVTINGVETELQSTSGGQFTGQITVPAQSTFTVVIDFHEMFSGTRLELGRAERLVTTGNGNLLLSLQSEDYDFNSFDADGDSVSNLQERQAETNPLDPLDPSQLPESVEIEVIAALPVEATTAGYSDYQIEVSVGTESVTAAAIDGTLTQTFSVLLQDTLTVSVRLIESTTGQGLVFGTQTRQVVNPPEFTQIIFDSGAYDLDSDQDADGFNDLDELIAGTDLFSPPESNQVLVIFTVVFDVPPELSALDNAFATLEINGTDVALTRTGNTYSGTAVAEAGSTIDIQAQFDDTFQGQSVVLATFGGAATPSAGETLQLEGFSLQIDTDNDGIANFVELSQGSDPFNPPDQQCTPVTETVFATLTDDGFQQDQFFNTSVLRVDEDDRITLMRYSFDESLGSVITASLNLTVTFDEGDGLLSVFSVEDFQWSDSAISVPLPALGAPVGSQENDWESRVEYTFDLNPDAISDDFTLFVVQTDGNDVGFGSSSSNAPPALELVVERCE